MKQTALGDYLVICPDVFSHSGKWCVVFVNKRWFWSSATILNSRAEAIKHRGSLIKYHKLLKIENDARKRKWHASRKKSIAEADESR